MVVYIIAPVILARIMMVVSHPAVGEDNKDSSEQLMKQKKFLFHNDNPMNWKQSLDHCNAVGMNLATISSETEQDSLRSLITDNNYGTWIGGSDMGDTGNYTWRSTSKPLTYTNWYPGEPDNHKYSDIVDHCIAVSYYTGKWFDEYCSTQLNHLCEYYS